MIHDHTPQNRRNAILFLRGANWDHDCWRVCNRPAISVDANLLRHSGDGILPRSICLLGRTRSPGRAALISTGLLCLLIVVPLMIVLHMAASQAMEIAKEIEARSASEGGFVPFLTRHISQAERSLDKYVEPLPIRYPRPVGGKGKNDRRTAAAPRTAGMVWKSSGFHSQLISVDLLTVYVLLAGWRWDCQRGSSRCLPALVKVTPGGSCKPCKTAWLQMFRGFSRLALLRGWAWHWHWPL